MSSSAPELNTVFVVPPKVVSPLPPPPPPYPSNHPQVLLYPGYQTQVALPYEQENMVHKIWKEGKVLGAIQILIGLIHIGFGAVLVITMTWGYFSISVVGGYPFWGGLSFIISGSFSVSAQKAPVTRCQVNGSVGMNIVSAIFSVIGIILLITELSNLWGKDLYDEPHHYYYYSGVSTGRGISSMLLLFSILEFVITSMISHSGCRMACCQTNQVPPVATPAQIVHPVIIPQQGVDPPFYSNVSLVNNNPAQGGTLPGEEMIPYQLS
ncbi:membrane-spanning 4-domains subfamily A member 8-like [Trichosurus vulpecula]|uniref:membrane-spanning 4-domains subfamily A member 8-like n=1 Tax=Trichosurus vulpecula TaxID=9337 RepID=UPI00186AE4F0|nr:membrane-spanning 4-domains subfamily A member 8-like [Trichosurus vulpecula]